MAPPDVHIVKTKSKGATTTAPINVDYKVVVTNEKGVGPVFSGLLTDTMYDPAGKVLYNRSWKLDTIAPGDEITLTYTVAFGTSTIPGIYKNVARVTGLQDYEKLPYANPFTPVEVVDTITFLSSGIDLGSATSTVATTDGTLDRKNTCGPLLTIGLRAGASNTVEVKKLQTFLAKDPAVYPQGIISGYFGPLTTAAVKRFQEKYAADILAPLGLKSGTGFAGPSTMKKLNTLACGGIAPISDATGTAPAPVQAPTPATKPKAPTPSAKKDTPGTGSVATPFVKAIGNLLSGFW